MEGPATGPGLPVDQNLLAGSAEAHPECLMVEAGPPLAGHGRYSVQPAMSSSLPECVRGTGEEAGRPTGCDYAQ